ncbi:MAG: nicotinate (nicotinamide) nucleotide adenylyltransferase [Candidatus Omnitrophica bacterium]|nr:nicotinate (nicotinamide) nucleotide adenylyltransferase [Candidatus Omnitrophota bacterium]
MAKSANKAKRIGILGGTFNPIHLGHLGLASQAMKKLSLSKVIFIPTYLPPHKAIRGNASPADRINMIRSAIKNRKSFRVSLYEINRKRKSYSIDTIKYFKRRLGRSCELYFLVGSDMLKGIRLWKDMHSILEIVNFVVCSRSHYAIKQYPAPIQKLRIATKDISSSQIRRLTGEKRSLKGLVFPKVASYIKKKGLYA